ncbi:ubiquitin carboxyl-terminal hydrolase 7 isoform X3 [Brachionus plicatilis]|uniref:Ubiquitin carboxyl-terminal hydrolase 7 isoform X3 n=1 Tax=Brachionus plicatilis TaxID=10195 RepID=A0A3M7T7D9_BRAPC|nr:ubiquitin carboxyl-terminal hydrolase 7 isoform X3 [Brachionus plicatilis]
MDDLSISLPCGFSAKYKDIFYSNGKFSCPVCKSHKMTSQECLKMERNKLILIEKTCELKKNHFDDLMMEFDDYKNDPKYHIDESYDCLKREVDLRREEIKAVIIQNIDDYHDGLLKKIDIERNLKLKELDEKIQKTKKLDLVDLNVDLKNLNISSKVSFYKRIKKKIDNGITLVTSIIDGLKEPKFKLTDRIDNIPELFGQLYLRENSKIILNNEEIDDDSRAEAAIQLTINNFSLLKDKKNFILYSEDCIVRNFKWYISIELNEEDGWMGFYVFCNSTAKSNKFPVNSDVELSLLNKSDSKKDLKGTFKKLYGRRFPGHGFPEFIKIN